MASFDPRDLARIRTEVRLAALAVRGLLAETEEGRGVGDVPYRTIAREVQAAADGLADAQLALGNALRMTPGARPEREDARG